MIKSQFEEFYDLKKDDGNLSICVIEEMSELTKVLCKIERKENPIVCVSDLIEEIAHVELLIDVIKKKYTVDRVAISYHKYDAMHRYFKERGV